MLEWTQHNWHQITCSHAELVYIKNNTTYHKYDSARTSICIWLNWNVSVTANTYDILSQSYHYRILILHITFPTTDDNTYLILLLQCGCIFILWMPATVYVCIYKFVVRTHAYKSTRWCWWWCWNIRSNCMWDQWRNSSWMRTENWLFVLGNITSNVDKRVHWIISDHKSSYISIDDKLGNQIDNDFQLQTDVKIHGPFFETKCLYIFV